MDGSFYIPIASLLIVGFGFVAMAFMIVRILSPRHPGGVKQVPYECGNFPIGDARGRYNPHFYLIAMTFILFEVEVAFIAPWVVNLRSLGWSGLIEIGIFVAILVLGLVFAWRKGDLEWE